jgi:hypothetical protein
MPPRVHCTAAASPAATQIVGLTCEFLKNVSLGNLFSNIFLHRRVWVRYRRPLGQLWCALDTAGCGLCRYNPPFWGGWGRSAVRKVPVMTIPPKVPILTSRPCAFLVLCVYPCIDVSLMVTVCECLMTGAARMGAAGYRQPRRHKSVTGSPGGGAEGSMVKLRFAAPVSLRVKLVPALAVVCCCGQLPEKPVADAGLLRDMQIPKIGPF